MAAELSRLGVSIDVPSDRVDLPGGRTLTREQQTQVRQLRGRTTRRVLDIVMRSPGYQRLSDQRKIDALERARRRINERVRAEMTRRVPGVVARASG